ncbi:MAG: hypothetical protein V3T58_01170 [Candidatus Hydrothermarchaeales archaeon]
MKLRYPHFPSAYRAEVIVLSGVTGGSLMSTGYQVGALLLILAVATFLLPLPQ